MTKIKIKQSKDGQFFFTVNSKNGQVRTTSETYTRKSDCRRAAKRHQEELKGNVKIEEAV